MKLVAKVNVLAAKSNFNRSIVSSLIALINLSLKPFLGRVGEDGVHAHSLVEGGLAPVQESAGAAVASARGREVPWKQAPVQTIHVQVRLLNWMHVQFCTHLNEYSDLITHVCNRITIT